jgi:hypothetical protein
LQECSGTVTVTGGQLVGAPGTAATSCPAGSYHLTSPAEQYCAPCPIGEHCAGGAGGAHTECAVDEFQPILGQPDISACSTCNATASPRYTSDLGAAYCTVPYVNITCGDGLEYDDSDGACVACASGYKRLTPTDTVCVAW